MRIGSPEWRKRLQTDAPFRDRQLQRLTNNLVKGFLTGAIAHGQIEVTGKSDLEIWKQLLKLIEDKHQTGGRWLFAIDHTDKLREIAREMQLAGQFTIQALLLATWVEHVANELVALGAHRRKIEDSEVIQMIRDTPLRARLTWLLELLGFPEFAPRHFSALMRLVEWRNQFVHYKWKHTESQDGNDNVERIISQSVNAIKFLSNYRTRQLLGGSKKLVRRLSRGSR